MLKYKLGKIAIGFSMLAGLAGCTPPEKVSDIRFSDDNFEKCVLDLGIEELDQVTRLECSSMDIESADEIEYFPQLNYLDLSSNFLSQLDVSTNQKLQHLEVWAQLSKKGLESLTFGTLPDLTYLTLDGDNLTKTDITPATFEKQLPSLEDLSILGTPIKGDFTLSLQHQKLRDLGIIDTEKDHIPAKLKLDLDLPALTRLFIQTPGLESLSLNNSHQLENVEVVKTGIKSLTLADMPNLTEVRLSDNKLSELTVTNLPALHYLDANNNQITSFDGRTLPALTNLYLSENQLKTIQYAQPNFISVLGLDNNQLTSFDFQLIPNITSYSLDNNPLAKVEDQFAKNTHLYYCVSAGEQLPYIAEITEIYCNTNGNVAESGDFTQYNSLELLEITAEFDDGLLDLSTLEDLKHLSATIYNLDTLKWPSNSALETVYLTYGKLKSLTIPTLPKLNDLELKIFNELETLTIAPQPSLTELELSGVSVPELTIAPQPSLTKLELSGGSVPELKMQQSPKLTKIKVVHSDLRHLTLEDMPALEQIQIFQAPLETLIIRKVPNLKEICLYYVPTTTKITSVLSNKKLQSLIKYDCR
ncbi:leucine-rich repeat domain-containing protein [Vibrio scophthalmi]|nr:leucine-rich repeat domain-containing protein [Vibrio scophthalmi]